jgi:hypothetical protein
MRHNGRDTALTTAQGSTRSIRDRGQRDARDMASAAAAGSRTQLGACRGVQHAWRISPCGRRPWGQLALTASNIKRCATACQSAHGTACCLGACASRIRHATARRNQHPPPRRPRSSAVPPRLCMLQGSSAGRMPRRPRRRAAGTPAAPPFQEGLAARSRRQSSQRTLLYVIRGRECSRGKGVLGEGNRSRRLLLCPHREGVALLTAALSDARL